MTTTTITNFRKNVYSMVENTVRFNEPVSITTKDGNAVMISEEEYLGLIETLYLTSVPGMKEKLVEGLQTPVSDTIPEEEVPW
ncbi:MAG: type II toxin-antitoxin system Phd/YefM family antitoxin [Lachnospiraceae bacterium]|nr:type II toxin-antitoxin system Phd/YefM family antitoxin [Lachnospiraceae bacterium]